MLNKMNLKYLNGSFYKSLEVTPEPKVTLEPKAPKLDKKNIIRLIRIKQLERAENKRRQIEKRKLVIPSTNLKISTPANFFRLR